MNPTVEETLSAIEEAVSKCHMCGGDLNANAPAEDFCSETCQALWTARRAEPAPVDGGQAPAEDLPETTPARPLEWLAPTPAELRPGHEVLDDVMAFVQRFSVFPDEHCAPTLALWYAHTHAADHFYVTPRLILDSAEPGSGKTRVLEVAELLVNSPEMTMSATPAALFRLVSGGSITILFDEVDAIFNPKSGGNEDLRGLLNAGYKRGATVVRCVGDAKTMKVQRFSVFAPAALAGIAGHMPATITTRAITIHMRRPRSDQKVEAFRQRTAQREAKPLRDGLANWAASIGHRLDDAVPDLPDGVSDRAAEIWEPLIAMADQAGGHWPDTARAACAHFVLSTTNQAVSLGVRLLADMRSLFTQRSTDRLPTKAMLAELTAMEEAPWGDFEGKPLDGRRLARELARFGVSPVPFKDETNTVVKGYVTYSTDRQVGLIDAWDRYLTPAMIEDGYSSYLGNHPGGRGVADGPVTDGSVTATPGGA